MGVSDVCERVICENGKTQTFQDITHTHTAYISTANIANQ